MITLRFEYASTHEHDKLFIQPLYLIAMNLKHQHLMKTPGKEYMIVNELTFPNLNAQDNAMIVTSSSLNDTDFNLNYILDRFNATLHVIYKNVNFYFNTDKQQVGQHSLRIGHDSQTVTNHYTITCDSAHLNVFEDLMQTSVMYFKKFSNWHKTDENRLKIYLSNDEGYFDSLGTRPKRSLDSVFLPKKQKTEITTLIETFLKPETIQQYKKLGVNHKLTMLLEGVPGTGKSSLISAVASHFKFDIAVISFTPKLTDAGFMRILRTWDQKIDMQKEEGDKDKITILVIEDMDCIFKERKSNDEARNMVSFSGILNGMDGITTSEHQILIMTTNHIEHLDPALIRPGRVDHIMRFDYAVKEQIVEMFNVYTGAKKEEKGEEFYSKVKSLNIKLTTSLLQQYLLKYMNADIEAILENVDELKQMYEAYNKQSAGIGLYN
jgi:AAA+ superfamily predicted ATPase